MIEAIPKKTLKFVRQLKQKKARKESNLYLISGWRAVQEAVAGPFFKAKYLLVEKGNEQILASLSRVKAEAIFGLSASEFAYISDEKTPQGIAVVAYRPEHSLQNLPAGAPLLYLEQIGDPGNLGTILRSALWFGQTNILLGPDSVDPYQPKTVRASAGAITYVRVLEHIDLKTLKELKAQNRYKIVGTSARGTVPLPEFRGEGAPVILAFGSEAHGLSKPLNDLCDLLVQIPRPGQGESLNLGVSVALFLYHLSTRQFFSRKEKE
jgi:TrmH family RNA methyltransferase